MMRRILTLLLALAAGSPALAQFSAEAQKASGRLLITFKAGTSAAERAAALKALGARAQESVDELDLIAAELPAFSMSAAQSKAAQLPQVAAVERDFYTNWLVGQPALPSVGEVLGSLPLDSFAGRSFKPAWEEPTLPAGVDKAELPWGIRRVNAPAAWAKTKGEGVRVAVIDTGIDPNHPDLKANFAGGYAAAGSSYVDENGHGTHVAGTIAGALDGKGVAGVAPKARLYAVRVLDKDGGGSLLAIIKGLVWCARNDIQVANMSLGAPMGTIFMRQAVKYAVSKGVTVVAAAGNNGGSVGYPGAYPEAIGISASDSSDRLAGFSSRGPEVDFIAPGVDVKSSIPGGGYDEYSGTSMATPHMSGLAALAVARGAKSPDAVRAALTRAAKKIGLKPEEQGAGMVDAAVLVR